MLKICKTNELARSKLTIINANDGTIKLHEQHTQGIFQYHNNFNQVHDELI